MKTDQEQIALPRGSKERSSGDGIARMDEQRVQWFFQQPRDIRGLLVFVGRIRPQDLPSYAGDCLGRRLPHLDVHRVTRA